jgi:hypothetical protein
MCKAAQMLLLCNEIMETTLKRAGKFGKKMAVSQFKMVHCNQNGTKGLL